MQPSLSISPLSFNPPPTLLSDALEAQLARSLVGVPKFLRLPQAGTRCQYTQLSRTALYELVAPTKRNGGKPPVQAIYQRAHRRAQRGTFLIPAENLFRYLLGLSASAVEDYVTTNSLRLAAGDEQTPKWKVDPICRKTQKKENKVPPPMSNRSTRTRIKEDLS